MHCSDAASAAEVVAPPAEPLAPGATPQVAQAAGFTFVTVRHWGEFPFFFLWFPRLYQKCESETKQNKASVHIFAQPLHAHFPVLSSFKLQLSERIK